MKAPASALPSAASRGSHTSHLANFDPVARIYRWAEYLALGSLLRRTREQFLPELTKTQRALVLGDGDGRFAAALLGQSPGCHVHAVDSSAAMLNLLRARCQREGTSARITAEKGSVLDVHADADCDLITTHFLLDCLSQSEVDALALRLAAQVKPPCRWLISEFGRPKGRVAGPLGAAYVRLLYLAFRLLTGLEVQHLPDPQRALEAAGFIRQQRVERLRGLLYAELWQLV